MPWIRTLQARTDPTVTEATRCIHPVLPLCPSSPLPEHANPQRIRYVAFDLKENEALTN